MRQDKDYRNLLRKEDSYKKEIITLTENNLQLTLELEKARHEVPRLKVVEKEQTI